MAGAGGQHPPPGAAGGAAAGAGAAVTPVAASAGPGEDSSDSEAEQEGPQKLIRKVSTSGQIRTKVSRAGSGGSAPGAQGTAAGDTGRARGPPGPQRRRGREPGAVGSVGNAEFPLGALRVFQFVSPPRRPACGCSVARVPGAGRARVHRPELQRPSALPSCGPRSVSGSLGATPASPYASCCGLEGRSEGGPGDARAKRRSRLSAPYVAPAAGQAFAS